MTRAGYPRYEISAYGDKPCIHNLNYWQFGDYLGIGAGAHGKLTNIPHQSIQRSLKPKAPKQYIRYPYGRYQRVGDAGFEFMLNALRLTHGFDKSLFQQRTGKSLAIFEHALNHAQDLGLLTVTDEYIRPTAHGLNFHNDLLALFLP